MIGYINGKVVGQMGNQVIVKIPSGLGYVINIGVGEVCMVNDMFERFIFQVDKEDKVDLYGFKTLDERKWVEKFLKVNGVGPKMAANIIFTLGIQKIQDALVNKDTLILGSVKGLGGKTAKKILLELNGDELRVEDFDVISTANSKTISDFTETLSSLGYKRHHIVSVIAELKREGEWDETNLKEMVKKGIKYFAK
jgi:holliday junction DNA helicase RuvA